MVATTTLVFGTCAWVVWADVTAFEDLQTQFSAGIAGAMPLMAWSVSALVGHMRYPGWWRLGLLVPLFIAITLVSTWFDVPGRVGWVMSRGEMERAAADCRTRITSSSSYHSEKVGAYQFYDIDRQPDGGCLFRLARDYPVVRSGFLYLPNGERRNGVHGHTYYVPLGGGWYYHRFDE
ncbi:hypothetical protein AB0G00_29340 [Nocardia salmonicida]|uniref:hypothetical protein n=1 Tax=Nocardia salmonicida TaxID=53431 RepID=UPI0033E09B6B